MDLPLAQGWLAHASQPESSVHFAASGDLARFQSGPRITRGASGITGRCANHDL